MAKTHNHNNNHFTGKKKGIKTVMKKWLDLNKNIMIISIAIVH